MIVHSIKYYCRKQFLSNAGNMHCEAIKPYFGHQINQILGNFLFNWQYLSILYENAHGESKWSSLVIFTKFQF